MLQKFCLKCNKEFFVPEYRKDKAKFCSQKCAKESLRCGKIIEYKCRYCSKTFIDSPSRNRRYCSKQCVNKEQKESFKPSYLTVRKMMIRRNMLKMCEICGFDSTKEILGIHHKDGNRKNNAKENLQILCPNCHSLAHLKHICHASVSE